MSRKRAHGAAISAPDESGFVPEQERVNARTEPPLPPSGGLAAFVSLLKLLSGVLIVIGASGAVAWGAHRYALTTPRFAVKNIELHGNRKKTDTEIVKLAALKPGTNIFAVDTEKAERALLEDPWIREVKVTRELPSTLRVELSEREAGAVAAIGDKLYLVTRAGEPFKGLADGDPFDLPVVTGIDAENLARDRAREIERIALGLEILRHYERVGMSKIHPAQEVHLMPGGEAVLTAGKNAVTLHLGNGPWRKKLLMAERVVSRLSAKGRVPGIVFLDNRAHPERVVVRMR